MLTVSSQLNFQWHHAGSLNLAIVGAFIPGKLANATNQGFVFLLWGEPVYQQCPSGQQPPSLGSLLETGSPGSHLPPLNHIFAFFFNTGLEGFVCIKTWNKELLKSLLKIYNWFTIYRWCSISLLHWLKSTVWNCLSSQGCLPKAEMYLSYLHSYCYDNLFLKFWNGTMFKSWKKSGFLVLN